MFRVGQKAPGYPFTVNNLGNDFGETSVVNDDGEELTQSNSDSSPLYGRVYNMTIHVSL